MTRDEQDRWKALTEALFHGAPMVISADQVVANITELFAKVGGTKLDEIRLSLTATELVSLAIRGLGLEQHIAEHQHLVADELVDDINDPSVVTAAHALVARIEVKRRHRPGRLRRPELSGQLERGLHAVARPHFEQGVKTGLLTEADWDSYINTPPPAWPLPPLITTVETEVTPVGATQEYVPGDV